MANEYITIRKKYADANYSSSWFYNLTMDIKIVVDTIENYQENTDVKRLDRPKGKSNWQTGFSSEVIELLQVNSAITITGSLSDPEGNTWAATTLNGGISDTATSIALTTASSFPSSGMIKIADEFIYYTGKSTNILTGCQRGFFDTTAVAHVDTIAVEDRTDGAEYYYALLDFIRKHGGGIILYWRNRVINTYISKFTVTDSKRESDGKSQEPTSYSVIINCFEATVR